MSFLRENRQITAIQQRINATWILRFMLPNDKINKTRRTVGEKPEIIVFEHKRDDNLFKSTNLIYNLIENNKRIAQKAVFWMEENLEEDETYEIRNKKNVFDYVEVDKNDR
jgi:hypothetical protein